jgi:cupin fold WbuC family metalloprotein
MAKNLLKKNVNFLKNKKAVKLISKKLLDNLTSFSYKTNNRACRICLHNNNNDEHQEMVILQKKYKYFPPKKNLVSDQTFFIISGQLLIVTFDAKGKVKSKIILSKKENLIARIKKNTYHVDIPISNRTIHFETKKSKFDPKNNKFAKFDFNLSSVI